MSIINKAHWSTEGDNVRLSMPFAKIDKERRIVSGFATLDNLDRQNDIVTTDASLMAFSKFRGNIREMHQPSAVGKMIAFKEDKYFDPDSKKFYSGVFVSAYVSKGAQNAWEKVLDGTYTGFSIGGKMNKWDDGYDEKMDKPIRIIKDYDLIELSLVDNPANQFASIISIEKVNGVDVLKGSAADIVVENVFWDKDSGLVMVSENETEISPTSGQPMKNIGFVEKTDNEKTDMIKFLVDSAKGISTTEIQKEVSPMTNETTAVVEDVKVAPEATDVDTVTKSVEVEEAPVAETTEATEAVVETELAKSEEVAKATEEIVKSDEVVVNAVAEIKETLASAFGDLAATIKSLNEETIKLVQTQVAELSKSITDVSKEVKSVKESNDEFGKRVDAVEQDTAFRKSGDLGEIVQEPEMVQKSLWGGRFLATDLFR
jgi:FtsZ-binding cell division protein ZapB